MRSIDYVKDSTPGPFTDDYLAAVEDAMGIKFPHSYIDFLHLNNGGEPVQRFFKTGANEKVVERFLSLVEDYRQNQFGLFDIEVVWSQIEDRLDDGIWPLAVVYSGDFLCFDCRGLPSPRVVLWEHQSWGADALEPTVVADSFEQFLEMLYA